METKRFIGNDMSRLYDRVRREFGPDAVIVRPAASSRWRRAAHRAARGRAGEAQPDLALDLQWTMVDGALGRLQRAKPSPTIGDLEDMVAREPEHLPPPRLSAPASADDGQAGWMEGFVSEAPAAPRGAYRAEEQYQHEPPPEPRGPRWQPARSFEDLPEEEAPAPVRWAARPPSPPRPAGRGAARRAQVRPAPQRAAPRHRR